MLQIVIDRLRTFPGKIMPQIASLSHYFFYKKIYELRKKKNLHASNVKVFPACSTISYKTFDYLSNNNDICGTNIITNNANINTIINGTAPRVTSVIDKLLIPEATNKF